jgi:hypothetical protein
MHTHLQFVKSFFITKPLNVTQHLQYLQVYILKITIIKMKGIVFCNLLQQPAKGYY